MGGLSIVFCMFTRGYRNHHLLVTSSPGGPLGVPAPAVLPLPQGPVTMAASTKASPRSPLEKMSWLWLVYAWFMPFIVSFPITNGDFNHLAGWWCNFSILKNMSSAMGFG